MTTASASPSVDCGMEHAAWYEPGSPEDLYRQPAGCPSGVDKIPAVKSSISAASAVTAAVIDATQGKDPLHTTGTSTFAGVPSAGAGAGEREGEGETKTVPAIDATGGAPLHRSGGSTYIGAPSNERVTQPAAAPSVAAQEAGKENSGAAARRAGVTGVLAAVAFAVVNC